MNRQFFLSLLGAFALFQTTSRAEDIPKLTAKDLSQFTPISEGIKRAATLTLYEGLPHQHWEAQQLEKELAAKKTVRFHGYPFYERSLAISTNEVELLRRLSADTESYWSYGGEKLCGGYHPDYCLEWKDGEATYHLLICFGCDEMKLYGPKSELLLDIRTDVMKKFESVLKKHRSQRPKKSD